MSIHRRIYLLQVFAVFLITCRNGPPVCDKSFTVFIAIFKALCRTGFVTCELNLLMGVHAFERSSVLFISPSFFSHLKRKWIGLSISLSEPPGNRMIRLEILCTPSLCSAKWVIEIGTQCVAPEQGLRGITYAANDKILFLELEL